MSLKQQEPSMKRFPSVFLGLSIFLAGTLAAQNTSPRLSDRGVSEIESLLQQAVQHGTLPGVVAIVATKDRVLYHNAFGLMDVRKEKPMQKGSIFRMASMTKPVTSVAVMMLKEQGKLSLDDPVSKYLPSFKDREVIVNFNPADATYTTRKAAREILIRHLLTNTSGLAYAFSNDTVNRLQQKTRQPEQEFPLLYDPGTRWTYSSSTRVLGQVVEKITAMGLDKFFEQRIFGPLEMPDTAYSVPAAKASRVVTWHQRTKGKDGKLSETPNPEKIEAPVFGDGGLFSTTGDYIKFLQMFLNDGKLNGRTLLSKDSIQAMTKNEIGGVIVQT